MQIEVRLFAVARQQIGCESLSLELPGDATIGQLRQRLIDRYPSLAGVATRSMFAIAENYCKDDHPLKDGDLVAWIPPVSGG